MNAIESLEEKALSQLETGQYKEAIELYKELLCESDNDEWPRKIAYCYVQRAITFAARGMFNEAVVLWESHCQYSQIPFQAYEQYIVWLIETKNWTKIHSCLSQLTVEQLDKQYTALATTLGMLIISKTPKLIQKIPHDSAFLNHFNILQSALKAYENNEKHKFIEILKKIPYRSAFRDYRVLLKVMALPSEEMGTTRLLLAKIPENSPYYQVAKSLQFCALEGNEFVTAVLKLNDQQRKILGQIKGLNTRQIELIEQLFQYRHQLSAKVKFNLAIEYKSLLKSDVAQQFCLEQLSTYPAGKSDYSKNFSSINKLEEHRLNALVCERDGNRHDAEYFWKKCINILLGEQSVNNLKVALITRRVANLQENEEKTIDLLVESLTYDPDDYQSYFQVIAYFRKHTGSGKELNLWVNKMLDRFPQDIDALTFAINIEVEGEVYAKVSEYAERLLKIDPLNSFAKQALLSNFLTRVRQLIKGKKYLLVEKKIEQAERWELSQGEAIKIQLMKGFLCFATQGKEQGWQLIEQALKRLNGDPINVKFQAIVEAQLTGLSIIGFLRESSEVNEERLSIQGFTRLMEQLKEYSCEDNAQIVYKAFVGIEIPLKQSLLELEVDEHHLLTLCQQLDKANHFELLQHCIEIAKDQWKNPVWEYYQVYADVNGVPEHCQHREIQLLEDVRKQAMVGKYHRAVVLIDAFISRYYQIYPDRKKGIIDNFLRVDEELGVEQRNDPLESLFGHIPENIMLELDDKFDSLLTETSPEMLVELLKSEAGDEKDLISSMMKRPDLFTALLMYHAAKELGIDITVNIGDVLEQFGVAKQADFFSF